MTRKTDKDLKIHGFNCKNCKIIIDLAREIDTYLYCKRYDELYIIRN